LEKHSSPVTAIAFSPDGIRLISADRDGAIHICEIMANGEWARARTIVAEPTLAPTLNSIAITPDSKHIAACLFIRPGGSRSLTSTIALWNLADGSRAGRFETGRVMEWISSPAFSPDGKRLSASYLRYAGQGQ